MARALKVSETSFEPVFDPVSDHTPFEFNEYDGAVRHARGLQARLAATYGAAYCEAAPGMSVRQRAAIIIGAAGLLWLLMGVAALAIFG